MNYKHFFFLNHLGNGQFQGYLTHTSQITLSLDYSLPSFTSNSFTILEVDLASAAFLRSQFYCTTNKENPYPEQCYAIPTHHPAGSIQHYRHWNNEYDRLFALSKIATGQTHEILREELDVVAMVLEDYIP